MRDFSGNTLKVKATGLVDPATPANQGFGPKPGSRFVALLLTLTSAGPGTVSSDANSNLTLVGTDGQGYTADFNTVNECTNFSNGNYTLFNGDTEKGCVVFQLPDGVKVQSAQFSLGNGTVQFNNG